MNCRKCKKELPEGAAWCCWCGAKQNVERKRRRGNGEGSVFKRGAKWAARYRHVDGEIMTDKYKGNFATKAEALEWLKTASALPRTAPSITFGALYDQWIKRHAVRVSASTIDCYKAAYKYFEPVVPYRFAMLTTEQLQACVDACPQGTRTKENMKALCTCMYKYAREIGVTNEDYGQYIYVVHRDAVEKRTFTRAELAVIRKAASKVQWIDMVLIMCYTGFRINEICAMNRESFDPIENALTGGSKTEAGMRRVVPVSSVIAPHVTRWYLKSVPDGPLFQIDGKRITTNHLRDLTQKALKQLPCLRPLMPHEFRHTFATMMKSTNGAREDKRRLIGHASDQMLEHYTHADIEDLRSIIAQL